MPTLETTNDEQRTGSFSQSLAVPSVMKEMTTFRIRWRARGKKEEVYEVSAASEDHARRAFEAYRLGTVSIISIERVEPDAAVPPLLSNSPDAPFSPLIAWRKLDTDEDAK